jgi:flagellar protein FliO/FliZ
VSALSRKVRGVAYALLGTAAPAVFAAEPFAAPKAAGPMPATSAGSLAQVTLSLLLVLAAVFAAAWVVRRLRGFGRFGGGALQVVAEIAVGAKERAVLIQVGKQQLLIGVAPGRVSTLHVLSEPIEGQRTQAPSDSTPAGGTPAVPPQLDFKNILKRSLGL